MTFCASSSYGDIEQQVRVSGGSKRFCGDSRGSHGVPRVFQEDPGGLRGVAVVSRFQEGSRGLNGISEGSNMFHGDSKGVPKVHYGSQKRFKESHGCFRGSQWALEGTRGFYGALVGTRSTLWVFRGV